MSRPAFYGRLVAFTSTLFILSLCDLSGVWSDPYLEAGYKVVRVDSAYPAGKRTFGNLTTLGCDIHDFRLECKPWAILAAPPCTTFCRPGARWWKLMDARGETARDVATFERSIELCRQAEGWWALENPPGRHRDLIEGMQEPAWQFQPWEYGDPWVKQTYIWGTAVKPPVTDPVKPEPTRRAPSGHTQGRIAYLPGSAKAKRAETPSGFARAFFRANP